MNDNLFNLAFERSLLSSILFDVNIFEDIKLKSTDFYLPTHQAVFEAMQTLIKEDKPMDEEFLKIELLKHNSFDESVMLEIISTNPISNIKPYQDEIIDKSRLRKLLNLSNILKKTIIDDGGKSDDVIAEVENQLINLDSANEVDMPMDMNEAIENFKTMTLPPRIKTGISAIDNMLCGGIESAQLVHIGGDSNVGKTILTKQILKNIADTHKVLFFSFEMPQWKLAKQLANTKFNRQNYFITDSKMMGNDVSDVSRMIKRMVRKNNIRFIVIDSKMKLTHNSYKGHSSVERIAEIDAILARLCQELDIVIFMITQLSKEDQRNGTMSGYGSGLSDYEADMKLLLSFVDGENDTRRKLEVKKNRQDVKFEPVNLRLNTQTLEFDSSTVVETIYDSNSLPFGKAKINVVHETLRDEMPQNPEPIQIEGAQFL